MISDSLQKFQEVFNTEKSLPAMQSTCLKSTYKWFAREANKIKMGSCFKKRIQDYNTFIGWMQTLRKMSAVAVIIKFCETFG